MQRAWGWGAKRHTLLDEAGRVQNMHEGTCPAERGEGLRPALG